MRILSACVVLAGIYALTSCTTIDSYTKCTVYPDTSNTILVFPAEFIEYYDEAIAMQWDRTFDKLNARRIIFRAVNVSTLRVESGNKLKWTTT